VGDVPPWWLWMQVVLVLVVVAGMVIAIVKLATT
jgi:ABC-type multidrug transport system permease subunit